MWVPVLAANLTAVALAICLPILDTHLGDQRSLPITNSAVQSIFGALAGGMITFTGIVFSAVFVAAQIQTSSYSPRLAARLRRDPVIIAGLALPTATATYALFGLAAIGRQTDKFGHDFVPAATVLFALVLAFVTLGAFVALVQRAFENTQIGGILRSLMRRGYAVIEEVHPHHAQTTVHAPEPDGGRRTILAYRGRRRSSPPSTGPRCCAWPSDRAVSSRSCRWSANTSSPAAMCSASAAPGPIRSPR